MSDWSTAFGGGASTLDITGLPATVPATTDELPFYDVSGTANGKMTVATLATTLGVRQDNVAATAAPTATDDSGAGYSVGSVWIDVTNDNSYTCVDATAAAAVWVQTNGTSLQNNYAATAAPTATDDSAAGYAVGSVWVDVTNDNSYTCVDATATAAVWQQTNSSSSGVPSMSGFWLSE